jgi:hypothetical protein
MRRQLIALVGCCLVLSAFARSQQASEYEVKAAMLLNFARFTDWPDRPSTPTLPICVVSNDAVAGEIERVLKGKQVGQQQVEFRRVKSGNEARSCRVLFFTAAAYKETKVILADNSLQGVLTVGDSDSFLRIGGVLAFRLENDRIRFEVSLPACNRQSIRLSAKMLSVASVVHGQ